MNWTTQHHGANAGIRRRVRRAAVAVAACLWIGWAHAQDPAEHVDASPPVHDAAPAEEVMPMPPEVQTPPVEAPVEEDTEVVLPQEPPAPPPPAPAPRALPVRPKPVRPPVRPSEMRNAIPAIRGSSQPKSEPAPADSANDPLPKDGATPTEPISFDFNNQDLSEVVAAIARMTGKNFDVDPSIAAAKVTIITHSKIPPEMAYQVLQSILQSRNFSMVETLGGKLVKIVPANDLLEKIPIKKGVGDLPADMYDQLQTHVVQLQHADSAEIMPICQNLGSKVVQVHAYQKTNTLIITDTTDGLRRIFTFIEEVDVPGFDSEMEIFTLEYSRAEVLSQQIQEVLMGSAGGAPRPGQPAVARPPQPVVRPSTRPTVPGQSVSTVTGSRDETLRIVPDDRLNSLIVVASAELMKRVRDLVAKLDTPTPYEANNMNIYKLLNADSEKVEKALNAILGTGPRQGTEKAPAQSGEIQPFEKKVIVTRYEENNSLIILASPQDYKLIKEIIAQLDIPQRQVLVESIIMNVTLNDKFELNVNAASLTGSDGFVTTGTDMMASQATGLTAAAAGLASATTATGLANQLATGRIATAASLLTLASGGQFTAGVYRDITAIVDVPGLGKRRIHLPFVPLLIKSLQTLTDTDILSQPSLTTQDNQEANIVVGQELPIVTSRPTYTNPGSSTIGGGANQYYNPYYGYGASSVTRQDVGVKMKVKPHINEGDYISLETEIEVSSQATNSSIDANNLGPTLNKSKVTNNVVVKDGCTGVIGGLITESTSHTKNQTPILGSLPLIGWAFGSKNNSRNKQNMVVLVTPHIIKEGADLDRISQYKMKEFHDENVDILFQKGIIKKVRKGSHMRNTHRPSVERTEKMMENKETFGRGDIER